MKLILIYYYILKEFFGIYAITKERRAYKRSRSNLESYWSNIFVGFTFIDFQKRRSRVNILAKSAPPGGGINSTLKKQRRSSVGEK